MHHVHHPQPCSTLYNHHHLSVFLFSSLHLNFTLNLHCLLHSHHSCCIYCVFFVIVSISPSIPRCNSCPALANEQNSQLATQCVVLIESITLRLYNLLSMLDVAMNAGISLLVRGSSLPWHAICHHWSLQCLQWDRCALLLIHSVEMFHQIFCWCGSDEANYQKYERSVCMKHTYKVATTVVGRLLRRVDPYSRTVLLYSLVTAHEKMIWIEVNIWAKPWWWCCLYLIAHYHQYRTVINLCHYFKGSVSRDSIFPHSRII